MKVVGLIAEYNPFHNGHQYHIEQALKLTGADAALVIMSGNHVQRGAPAFLPKHLRTEAALQCGAAAVFELPVCYSTGSAEYFALGAVSFLELLGCVDSICFGSETDDIQSLQEIAKILVEEPGEYRKFLQENLKSGLSFPTARQQALADYTGTSDLTFCLGQPNNILGIEYLKALLRLKSSIIPYALKRTGSGYHDLSTDSGFSSASAIRNLLLQTEEPDSSLFELVPQRTEAILSQNWNKRYPICTDDYSLLLKYKLLSATPESLNEYMDITEDLANRIIRHRNQFLSFDQFCNLLKTKQLTYTRISRALLHIVLGIRKTELEQYAIHHYHGYARLLGFRLDYKNLLTLLKEKSSLPILSKLSAKDSLEEPFSTMLEQDIFASDLYESIVTDKFHSTFINEYQQPVIRI